MCAPCVHQAGAKLYKSVCMGREGVHLGSMELIGGTIFAHFLYLWELRPKDPFLR